MSKSSFELFKKKFLEAAVESTTSDDVALANHIFTNTSNFLASNNLVTSNVGAGMESLTEIPKLIINRQDSYANLDIEALESFLDECKVPKDAKVSCAIEVARILSGANESSVHFYDKGRARGNSIPMNQIYGSQAIAMINGQAAQAIESFGEYSDRVTSDSRLAVALTVLRAHKSLVDRVFARKAVEDPVVIIKIPSPEVYNLEMSNNPVASVRYSAQRQPLVALYRDPTFVNTQPQQIVPLKANDDGSPAYLYANGILNAGVKVNLFDMTLQANTVGFDAVNWTDLVSDGGSIGSILIQVTQTVSGSPDTITTELYSVSTQYYRSAQFVTQTNVNDSGDRMASLRMMTNFTVGQTMSNGDVSTIFAGFSDVNVCLDIQFNANMNVKTSYADGAGSITPSINTTLTDGVPSAVQTTYGELTFAIIGWSPYLFFSEENMRKTTAAVRMNYKEQEFIIPVGKNFIVDYSLQGQEIGEDVTNVVSNVIGIGNSARSVSIIDNTLQAVYARLQYENANPDIDYLNTVSQDYAAGTLCLPHVWVGTLDVSQAAVMRESERLSDLHSYITSRLTALIADGHNKSMYTENFEPGERARYKVMTSGPIAEILFGIMEYWNTLDDKLPVAENSDYSLKLPNGTQLDIIKSNFEFFANTMMLVPIRDAKPDDVTSFGTQLDRGTFVGQYTPVSNGAANKRIVANSREIMFPTNPLGYLITVSGIQTELSVLVDGPGLSE